MTHMQGWQISTSSCLFWGRNLGPIRFNTYFSHRVLSLHPDVTVKYILCCLARKVCVPFGLKNILSTFSLFSSILFLKVYYMKTHTYVEMLVSSKKKKHFTSQGVNYTQHCIPVSRNLLDYFNTMRKGKISFMSTFKSLCRCYQCHFRKLKRSVLMGMGQNYCHKSTMAYLNLFTVSSKLAIISLGY